ncbi:MAG: hypothetical protein KJ905_03090 [Nanoarchaeota archaeon]|nr:hypothetical protein [Nanoarchaeota archaeon]MBU1501734.1 hypothetical protein [Nanoarchaeota archaeon]
MTFEECSVCGISGTDERLMEVISLKEKGIVKICGRCSQKEHMPILKRPTTFQLKESERSITPSVRSLNRPERANPVDSRRTEMNLREIVDKNYERLNSTEKKPRPDLIEHFHWVIMCARRRKKLTHEQLARDISESTAAIKMAEEGILPEDDYRLVSKLESFLGIRLVRDRGLVPAEYEKSQPSRILNFDPQVMQNLTIDDLKRMKKERDETGIGVPQPGGITGEESEEIAEDKSPSVFSSGDLEETR